MEQNKENTSSVSRTLKEYCIITVAVLIMDIGIYVFKFPNIFLSAEYPEWLLFLQNFFPLLPL